MHWPRLVVFVCCIGIAGAGGSVAILSMLKGLSAAYALGLLHAGLIGLAVAAIFRAFIVVLSATLEN